MSNRTKRRNRQRRGKKNNRMNQNIPSTISRVVSVPRRILQTLLPGEKYFSTIETGLVTLKTNTVTTGVLTSSDTFNLSDLDSFLVRYGGAFGEYLIFRLDYKVTPVSISTGYSKFWIDHQGSGSTLVNSEVDPNAVNVFHTINDGKSYTKTYKVQDYEDLGWNGTSGSPGPFFPICSFNLYTNAANYGAPIVATPLYTVQFKAWVIFKGHVG